MDGTDHFGVLRVSVVCTEEVEAYPDWGLRSLRTTAATIKRATEGSMVRCKPATVKRQWWHF